MSDRYIVFDCELGRPGCVLIQAALGGDPRLASKFPSETWLLSPTPNMKKYKIDSDDQIKKLIRLAIFSSEKR